MKSFDLLFNLFPVATELCDVHKTQAAQRNIEEATLGKYRIVHFVRNRTKATDIIEERIRCQKWQLAGHKTRKLDGR